MGKREGITETLRERGVAQHKPDARLTYVHDVCQEFGVSTGTAVAAMATSRLRDMSTAASAAISWHQPFRPPSGEMSNAPSSQHSEARRGGSKRLPTVSTVRYRCDVISACVRGEN